MRILSGLGSALLLAVVCSGQVRPGFTGSFGNVVFPGGTAAIPGVQRSFGNVAFPGTGGPRFNIPFSITDPTLGARLGANVGGRNVLGSRPAVRHGAVAVPYAVPVYVGGGYGGYYDGSYQGAPPPQQQPNITVIYPPQPAPVIINQFGPGNAAGPPPDTVSLYQAPVTGGGNASGESMNERPSGFLIALQDHTIYSAVAYWIEGDTLHYFTTGNVHNQASVALVDRELTERLNREKGTEVRLPPKR